MSLLKSPKEDGGARMSTMTLQETGSRGHSSVVDLDVTRGNQPAEQPTISCGSVVVDTVDGATYFAGLKSQTAVKILLPVLPPDGAPVEVESSACVPVSRAFRERVTWWRATWEFMQPRRQRLCHADNMFAACAFRDADGNDRVSILNLNSEPDGIVESVIPDKRRVADIELAVPVLDGTPYPHLLVLTECGRVLVLRAEFEARKLGVALTLGFDDPRHKPVGVAWHGLIHWRFVTFHSMYAAVWDLSSFLTSKGAVAARTFVNDREIEQKCTSRIVYARLRRLIKAHEKFLVESGHGPWFSPDETFELISFSVLVTTVGVLLLLLLSPGILVVYSTTDDADDEASDRSTSESSNWQLRGFFRLKECRGHSLHAITSLVSSDPIGAEGFSGFPALNFASLKSGNEIRLQNEQLAKNPIVVDICVSLDNGTTVALWNLAIAENIDKAAAPDDSTVLLVSNCMSMISLSTVQPTAMEQIAVCGDNGEARAEGTPDQPLLEENVEVPETGAAETTRQVATAKGEEYWAVEAGVQNQASAEVTNGTEESSGVKKGVEATGGSEIRNRNIMQEEEEAKEASGAVASAGFDGWPTGRTIERRTNKAKIVDAGDSKGAEVGKGVCETSAAAERAEPATDRALKPIAAAGILQKTPQLVGQSFVSCASEFLALLTAAVPVGSESADSSPPLRGYRSYSLTLRLNRRSRRVELRFTALGGTDQPCWAYALAPLDGASHFLICVQASYPPSTDTTEVPRVSGPWFIDSAEAKGARPVDVTIIWLKGTVGARELEHEAAPDRELLTAVPPATPLTHETEAPAASGGRSRGENVNTTIEGLATLLAEAIESRMKVTTVDKIHAELDAFRTDIASRLEFLANTSQDQGEVYAKLERCVQSTISLAIQQLTQSLSGFLKTSMLPALTEMVNGAIHKLQQAQLAAAQSSVGGPSATAVMTSEFASKADFERLVRGLMDIMEYLKKVQNELKISDAKNLATAQAEAISRIQNNMVKCIREPLLIHMTEKANSAATRTVTELQGTVSSLQSEICSLKKQVKNLNVNYQELLRSQTEEFTSLRSAMEQMTQTISDLRNGPAGIQSAPPLTEELDCPGYFVISEPCRLCRGEQAYTDEGAGLLRPPAGHCHHPAVSSDRYSAGYHSAAQGYRMPVLPHGLLPYRFPAASAPMLAVSRHKLLRPQAVNPLLADQSVETACSKHRGPAYRGTRGSNRPTDDEYGSEPEGSCCSDHGALISFRSLVDHQVEFSSSQDTAFAEQLLDELNNRKYDTALYKALTRDSEAKTRGFWTLMVSRAFDPEEFELREKTAILAGAVKTITDSLTAAFGAPSDIRKMASVITVNGKRLTLGDIVAQTSDVSARLRWIWRALIRLEIRDLENLTNEDFAEFRHFLNDGLRVVEQNINKYHGVTDCSLLSKDIEHIRDLCARLRPSGNGTAPGPAAK